MPRVLGKAFIRRPPGTQVVAFTEYARSSSKDGQIYPKYYAKLGNLFNLKLELHPRFVKSAADPVNL